MEQANPIFTGLVLLVIGVLTIVVNDIVFNNPIVRIVGGGYVVIGIAIVLINAIRQRE